MNSLNSRLSYFALDTGNIHPLLSALPGLVVVWRLSRLIVGDLSLLHFLMLLVACLVVIMYYWCGKSLFSCCHWFSLCVWFLVD